MSDDCPYKKAVICRFEVFRDLFSLAQVNVHSVIIYRNRLQVEVPHSVYFELECQSWFQVTVYAILGILQNHRNQFNNILSSFPKTFMELCSLSRTIKYLTIENISPNNDFIWTSLRKHEKNNNKENMLFLKYNSIRDHW